MVHVKPIVVHRPGFELLPHLLALDPDVQEPSCYEGCSAEPHRNHLKQESITHEDSVLLSLSCLDSYKESTIIVLV